MELRTRKEWVGSQNRVGSTADCVADPRVDPTDGGRISTY